MTCDEGKTALGQIDPNATQHLKLYSRKPVTKGPKTTYGCMPLLEPGASEAPQFEQKLAPGSTSCPQNGPCIRVET